MRFAPALSSLALVGLLSAAGPARAEEEKSCRQQLEELCPDSAPNTPERRACVQKNAGKLTASCQKMIGHGQSETPAAAPASGPGGFEGFVKACQKDQTRVAELCQKGRPPQESPLPCLIEKADQFSKPCRNWLEEAKKAQAAAQKPSASPPGAGKPAAGAKPPAAN
jgi:hypothetical protein